MRERREGLSEADLTGGRDREVDKPMVYDPALARAYQLAAWYRAMGSKVVLGGMHVHACEEEVAAHADAISVGDGVQTWPAILRGTGIGSLLGVLPGGGAAGREVHPERRGGRVEFARHEVLPRSESRIL